MQTNKPQVKQEPVSQGDGSPKRLDPSDLQLRFSISTLLRQVENDIDTIHTKWLQEQAKCGQLTKLLEEANAKILRLETELVKGKGKVKA